MTEKLTPFTDFMLPRLSSARITRSRTDDASDTGGCGGLPDRAVEFLEPFVDLSQLEGMLRTACGISGNVTLLDVVPIPSPGLSLSCPSVVS